MHIKQLTIFNFRSFQQQPEIHPFSSGTNSVVGRNGSGKSNLFDAVQFVLLSPRFYSLSQDQRQRMLHEGAGSAAVNAFVEVVFDNSDNRFSLENSDEVVLRRTIGPKKDEFFLQRKRATKQEISSLLEGAGFSKSNPYFMIQQGKIQDICTMRDSERLALLKQVAGTTVYDEKKQESLAKMEENQGSIDKISQILQDIEKRLEELQGEKEELTEYQSLDRKRRAMEYTLYDKELRHARKNLDKLEHDRLQHTETVSELHDAAKETHDQIRNVEANHKTKSNALKRHANAIKVLENDKTAAVKHHKHIEIECKELEDSINTAENQEKSNSKELEQVKAEIAKAQQELDDIQPKFAIETKNLQQIQHVLKQTRKQADDLHAKQGRGQHYGTKEERDKFLMGQIQYVSDNKTEKERMLAATQEKLASLRRTVKEEEKELKTREADVSKKREQQQTFNKALEVKRRERIEVVERRQKKRSEMDQLEESLGEAESILNQATSNMDKVIPRNTNQGLQALENMILHEEKLEWGKHYFGMVMDNFRLKDPKFQTAVERAVENSLFHVIVDTEVTAARLVKRLEEGKYGRVTFLPLNRIRVEQVDYPRNIRDVSSMLELCLDYEPKVAVAIEHVFSRKLVAANLEAATEWSKKLRMDTVCLDGDIRYRKGALNGGYFDSNKSRLKLYEAKKQAKDAREKAGQVYSEFQQECNRINQEAANLQQEVNHSESKHRDILRQVKEGDRELEKRRKKIEKCKKQIEQNERMLSPCELDIQGFEQDIQRLQDEMKSELTATLSPQEKQTLASLKEAEKKLEADLEKKTEAVEEIGVERQRLQSLLEDNLKKRERELEGKEQANDDDDDGDEYEKDATFAAKIARQKERLQEKRIELDAAARALGVIERNLADGRKDASNVKADLAAAKSELDRLQNEDQKYKKELEAAAEKTDRLLNKRNICVAKRETYTTKIQELGALPPPAEREAFAKKSVDELTKSLTAVNKKLKKYSHVNKKAYDQFVNFSEQRDGLLKRKDELDQGANKVKELVESLDRQKDEAINRTFRGVSAHFKDVFKELVPLGEGELVMRTAIDKDPGSGDDEDDDDDDDDDPQTTQTNKRKKGYDPNNPDVSLYRGVGVKVRFSAVGENFMMSQLSGGQKALVALALIFAIQRCDPAPFYIFDELDQALDSTYRASVANLIQKQSQSEDNPTQFIVSTFRPELVNVADQCYGISHQNKVSRFHHMSKNDALKFIANLMNEEENVGEVTSLTTSRASKKSKGSRKRKASAGED